MANQSATQMLWNDLSTLNSLPDKTSFASRQQRNTSLPLRTIGLGSCGTVFEVPGTDLAYKKGTNGAAIWNDFCLTNRVYNALIDARSVLRKSFAQNTVPLTPRCHAYHTIHDEKFWTEELLDKFPVGHQTRQSLFEVDRILPVPRASRDALVELFFADNEAIRKQAREESDNTDCLLRVYLGERESIKQQDGVYDTLRNFPLRPNMIEGIGLNTAHLAKEMAIGLAILHWQAQVDGMGVEFVLGSAANWNTDRRVKALDETEEEHNVNAVKFLHRRRSTHLWMLDFDKATRIHLTMHDVKTKLVPAFLGNDPYYPIPHVDKELWEVFSEAYLRASGIIISVKSDKTRGLGLLPKQFLKEVVSVSKEKEKRSAEDYIMFEDSDPDTVRVSKEKEKWSAEDYIMFEDSDPDT